VATMAEDPSVLLPVDAEAKERDSKSKPVATARAAAVLGVLSKALSLKQDRPELVQRLIAANGDLNSRINPPLQIGHAAGGSTSAVAASGKSSKVAPASQSTSAPANPDVASPPLIHAAALLGLSETFAELFNLGASTSWRDSVGWTLLHACASGGQVGSLLVLLDLPDANVDVLDNDGDTPLHVATYAGRIEATRLLLDRSADPLAVDGDRCSPLHCACRAGAWPLVQLLLAARSDAGAGDLRGGTPLAYAVLSHKEGFETEGLPALLNAGARVCQMSLQVAAKQYKAQPNCSRCHIMCQALAAADTQQAAGDLKKAEETAAATAAMLLTEEVAVKGSGSKKKRSAKNRKRDTVGPVAPVADSPSSNQKRSESRSLARAVISMMYRQVGGRAARASKRRESQHAAKQSMNNATSLSSFVNLSRDGSNVSRSTPDRRGEDLTLARSIVDAIYVKIPSRLKALTAECTTGADRAAKQRSSRCADDEKTQTVSTNKAPQKVTTSTNSGSATRSKGSLVERRARGDLIEADSGKAETRRLKRLRQKERRVGSHHTNPYEDAAGEDPVLGSPLETDTEDLWNCMSSTRTRVDTEDFSPVGGDSVQGVEVPDWLEHYSTGPVQMWWPDASIAASGVTAEPSFVGTGASDISTCAYEQEESTRVHGVKHLLSTRCVVVDGVEVTVATEAADGGHVCTPDWTANQNVIDVPGLAGQYRWDTEDWVPYWMQDMTCLEAFPKVIDDSDCSMSWSEHAKMYVSYDCWTVAVGDEVAWQENGLSNRHNTDAPLYTATTVSAAAREVVLAVVRRVCKKLFSVEDDELPSGLIAPFAAEIPAGYYPQCVLPPIWWVPASVGELDDGCTVGPEAEFCVPAAWAEVEEGVSQGASLVRRTGTYHLEVSAGVEKCRALPR